MKRYKRRIAKLSKNDSIERDILCLTSRRTRRYCFIMSGSSNLLSTDNRASWPPAAVLWTPVPQSPRPRKTPDLLLTRSGRKMTTPTAVRNRRYGTVWSGTRGGNRSAPEKGDTHRHTFKGKNISTSVYPNPEVGRGHTGIDFINADVVGTKVYASVRLQDVKSQLYT